MTRQPRLSRRQQQRKDNARLIYNYIRNFDVEYGYPPTITQIAHACYMSRTTVARHLDWLEAWGYLLREPGLPRAITIIDPKRRL